MPRLRDQDVTTIDLQSSSVGFITGHKGEGLRSIEGAPAILSLS
jgi:hypothetical protein